MLSPYGNAVYLLRNVAMKRFSSAARTQYPKLLQPLILGNQVLKNRVIMGSMHTNLEERSLEDLAAFYAERARGDVGLIVTGGIAPNHVGRLETNAAMMTTVEESNSHKVITKAVHDNGGKIAMQILHAGRNGAHRDLVSASAIQSPIVGFVPRAMTTEEVYSTIDDFVFCAKLAQQAGYDGVEVMGSEGYLLNQFIVKKTNKRTDEWGGSYDNRIKLPVSIVKGIRDAVGPDFIIIYRLSMLDLVDNGSTFDEVVQLAHAMESAGVSILNTGVGWHEARIPTIATKVPRAGYAWVTKKLRGMVNVPVCTSNRINSPDIGEQVLSDGYSDLISMARPFLADPHFVKKAYENRADEINTCIGCNQACLDHIFVHKRASCLVNPIAGFERSLTVQPADIKDRINIAVVGAGPAGLAFAVTAAQRGHKVTLFEKEPSVGGQFNMAKMIPGKEEFFETIRYFSKQLDITGVNVRLNVEVTVDMLQGYDAAVIATGVSPRQVNLPNKSSNVKCISYVDVIKNKAYVGNNVAVLGAGGIGFDVAEYLTASTAQLRTAGRAPAPTIDTNAISAFTQDWEIDESISSGGLRAKDNSSSKDISVSSNSLDRIRKVYLLQRKPGKLGAGLGKTTGWIHRSTIKKKGVEELEGCKYIEINDSGLVIERKGQVMTLPVDTVVLCAGQEPLRTLYDQLTHQLSWSTSHGTNAALKNVFMIGGAVEAGELDAKRAIDQGVRLASVVENATTGSVFTANYDN